MNITRTTSFKYTNRFIYYGFFWFTNYNLTAIQAEKEANYKDTGGIKQTITTQE